MTTQKQILRIFIIVIVLAVIFFGGRELYYARHVTQRSLQIKLNGTALAKNSSAIITGTVEKSLGAKRFTDENGEIMVNTRWQIKVDKNFKGSLPASIVVQTPGGRYGLTEVIVEDAPQLATGDKVLLYLQPYDNTSDYQVTGQFQGRFSLTTDQSGNPVYEQAETKLKKSMADLEKEIITANAQ